MTSDLHEQLRDLAAAAPPPAGDASALWRTGKRRQRRRTAAGAVAALAIVAAGVGGLGTMLPADRLPVMPAATDVQAALPDRLYVPSRWTESNDDDPVGPMAAVVSTSRGWSGDTGYAGVSAVSGEYRFLDLPGHAGTGGEDAPVLSPSGRYVAYWLGGAPDGSPRVIEEGLKPIVGVGIYDTVTGRAARAPVRTEHGLAPDRLLWVDAESVYFQASELSADSKPGSYSAQTKGQGWIARVGGAIEQDREAGAEPVSVRDVPEFASAVLSDHQGGLLFESWETRPDDEVVAQDPVLVDVESGEVRTLPVHDDVRLDGAAIRPDGAVGGLYMPNGVDSRPSTLAVSVDGQLVPLPDVEALDVWGWSGKRLVVNRVVDDMERMTRQHSLVAVDVLSGQMSVLTRMPDEGRGQHINVHGFASDLFAVPPVYRPAPDAPLDPRVALGSGAGTLLAGGLVGLVLWRRRVRS